MCQDAWMSHLWPEALGGLATNSAVAISLDWMMAQVSGSKPVILGSCREFCGLPVTDSRVFRWQVDLPGL